MAQKFRGLPIPESFWDDLAAKEEAEEKKKRKENQLIPISSSDEEATADNLNSTEESEEESMWKSLALQRVELSDEDFSKLLQLMSCNVCETLPTPTTYRLCARGHVQCLECLPKRDKCLFIDEKNKTVCKMELQELPVSQLYKVIYDETYFKCPNYGNGCQREFRGADVRQHYDKCMNRPIQPIDQKVVEESRRLLQAAKLAGRN